MSFFVSVQRIMSIFIIENTIYSDGTGDYAHFADIITFLKNSPSFKSVEIVPIVHFERGRDVSDEEHDAGLLGSGSKENYERIGRSMTDLMRRLDIKHYWYGNTSECERFFSKTAFFSKDTIQDHFTHQEEIDTFFLEQAPHLLSEGDKQSELPAERPLTDDEAAEQLRQYLESLNKRTQTSKLNKEGRIHRKRISTTSSPNISSQRVTKQTLGSYFSNKGEIDSFWSRSNGALNTGRFTDAFLENHEMLLGSAEQIILTSFNAQLIVMKKSHIEFYGHLLNKDIVKKTILDHESMLNDRVEGFSQYNMGLREGCYGIKIAPDLNVSKAQAFDVIKSDDPFSLALKEATGLRSLGSFFDEHVLVPAYFNKLSGLLGFINLLAINPSTSQNKHVVIHLSGFKKVDKLLNKLEKFEAYYHEKGVDVAYYHSNDGFLRQDNKTLLRKIILIDGMYLSNNVYQALYQQAEIAGVSGDNTFEQCVATNTLPFYRSTNYDDKSATHNALRTLCTTHVQGLSDEAKEAFANYFDVFYMTAHVFYFEKYVFDSHKMTLEKKEEIEELLVFEGLNFQTMMDEWDKVTSYLREHKNLYKRLEGIVKKDTSFEITKQSMPRQAMLAMTNAYGPGYFVPKTRRVFAAAARVESNHKTPVSALN